MAVGLTEVTMALVLVAFVAACRAVARACFAARIDSAAALLALLWSAAFTIAALGAVVARDEFSTEAAAMWSAAVLAMAAGAAWIVGRRWRERAMEREAGKLGERSGPDLAEARVIAPASDGVSGTSPSVLATVPTMSPAAETAPTATGASAAPSVLAAPSTTAAPTATGAPAAPDIPALCARAARAYDLTRREEDVLVLLIAGRTAAEVADELVVSPNTVKTHIRNLYRKLGINRRADLAARLGL